MDDHFDLDDPEAPHHPEGRGDREEPRPERLNPGDMVELCARMMLQNQQMMREMTKMRENEREHQRMTDEYWADKLKAKLEQERRMDAERQEERRQMRELQERFEEQRQADLRQRREELRERREEEERRARLKAIQLPPHMSTKTDLREFLELFEGVAERKELRREDWAPTVTPLLNDRFRSVAAKLPPEIKADYEALKQALLDRDDQHLRNPAATFWTLGKDKGVTALDYGQQLTRLADRFLRGEDRASCLDSIVMERFIQELTKDGRAWVRQRKPQSLLEATRLAEDYFHYHEESYVSWSSRAGDGSVEGKTPSQREKQPYRQWKRDYSPKRQEGDTPQKGEPKESGAKPPNTGDQPEAGAGQGQQPGGARGSLGGGVRCFLCGERGHKKPNCPKKQQKVNAVQQEVICQLCRGAGHEAGECPSRVSRIGVPLAKDTSWNSRRAGTVENKQVDNILMDSGAQVSIVARQTLPQDHRMAGIIRVKPLASPAIKCPATTVRVHLGKREFQVWAAVLDREDLGHDLLLGDNIPGLRLQDLMAETECPRGAGKESTPQPAVAPREDRDTAPSRATDQTTETPSGAGTQTTPLPPWFPRRGRHHNRNKRLRVTMAYTW